MSKYYNYMDNNLEEWYKIVYPILTHPEFQKRKTFKHHGDITVYDHCINVSIRAYLMAKKRKLNVKDAAVAGLLHDFYETPWTLVIEKKPLFQKHGFTHASIALLNAKRYFREYMNPVVENSILRHMFPLNIRPPKYRIGWLVTLADKLVSLEVIKEPEFFLKTFGIRR